MKSQTWNNLLLDSYIECLNKVEIHPVIHGLCVAISIINFIFAFELNWNFFFLLFFIKSNISEFIYLSVSFHLTMKGTSVSKQKRNEKSQQNILYKRGNNKWQKKQKRNPYKMRKRKIKKNLEKHKETLKSLVMSVVSINIIKSTF